MQPIIEKIYQNSLSDNEKFKAMFLNDTSTDYFVYAWVEDDNILCLGYGKDSEYLHCRPAASEDENTDTPQNSMTVVFPYKDLSEKEAFVLCKYEQLKMEKFGYHKLSDIGVLT